MGDCLLVCTGFPSFALSSNKLNNLRAIKELGYVCCNVPLLATTSSAVYGRLMPAYLGVSHQSFTAWTCASNRASSAPPAFSAVARSWKESDGSVEDTGGSTVLRVELDIRQAVVVIVRRGVADGNGRLKQRACRQAVRKVGRNMVVYWRQEGTRAPGRTSFYKRLLARGLVMFGKSSQANNAGGDSSGRSRARRIFRLLQSLLEG
jgi:hypothetical protein